METNVKVGIVAGVIAAGVVLSAILTGAAGIFSMDVFRLGAEFPDYAISILLSPAFIGLTLIFPAIFGFISAATKILEKKEASVAAGAGGIIGVIIALIIFGFGFRELLLSVSLVIGILISVQMNYMSREGLKTMVMFRSSTKAARKAFLVLAIGLFISTAINAMEHEEENVAKLGDTVMQLSIKQDADGQNVTELSADLLINTQKQVVGQILELPQFTKLREKEDPDVQSFVVIMDTLNEKIDSPETRASVIKQLNEKQNQEGQIITFDLLRKSSPMINTIAEYYWVILSFTIVSTFLFFANVVLSNLVGIYAALMRRMMKSLAQESK